jgi:TonB family protein
MSTEWVFIPNNAVIQSQSYRGNVPVGIWIQANKSGKVTQELDYRFELRYSTDSCVSGYRYRIGSDTLQQHISGLFTSPQLIGYKDALSYLFKHLRYPASAMENGIEGRVTLSMSLSKEGSLSDIVVLKSADTLLDAEAFRVVRSMREWKPATIDGKPINLCIAFPIIFKLD